MGTTQEAAAKVDAWLSRCADPATDPLQGMAETGLLEPETSYARIARIKALLVERTGLLGVGGIWAGRQVVNRWFLQGFGTTAQRAAWLGHAASVAISEPGAGAHPKRLTTHADADGEGYCISGAKAWVSNGPSAEVFVVLAITAREGERKRYSAFLVPHDAPGLSLQEMPAFHALRPSRHCGLRLDRVPVARDALLGTAGNAYEAMALPFRDVEDAVGTLGLLGAFRFLLRALSGSAESDEAAAMLGGLAASAAVFEDAADALLAALDAGRLNDKAATLVGLRVLATDMTQRFRAYVQQCGRLGDPAIEDVLRDIDATLSVARGPRLARQIRLAG
ncbi:MAG TPA: acyl-CoA dehydrogenase family protein [Acetobacteraceae bacterium]|nr:acyl-CoA dehydrogenase family protein [Acetobacteraceae bacterium]